MLERGFVFLCRCTRACSGEWSGWIGGEGGQLAHPEVRLEVTAEDRAVDMIAEGYDLLIRVAVRTCLTVSVSQSPAFWCLAIASSLASIWAFFG